MTPGIIAAFIFNFVNCWNELFLSVSLMNTRREQDGPFGPERLHLELNIDWGSMSAAAVLTIIPTMVMFALREPVDRAGPDRGSREGLTTSIRPNMGEPTPVRPCLGERASS